MQETYVSGAAGSVANFLPSANAIDRPGTGYLEALTQPNVTAFTGAGLDRVTPRGVIAPDGSEHEVDVIICAVSSGFDGIGTNTS